MEHEKKLEELNKEALDQLDQYMKARGEIAVEHNEKIDSAKVKWQAAWNEFLETLVVLQKVEI